MKRVAADSLEKPISNAASSACWHARLSLGFADDAGTTRMVECRHAGPLRVQKPLYPEGGQVCHAIVLHPPGGVVGGDELDIAASVGPAAKALITTPGAAKWYKANGRISRQDVRLEIGANAALEWLPQETIFFNAAQVRLDHAVSLARDADYIGCEILCFGRTASGESFDSGRIEQRISIRRGGRLIWFEQGAISGGSSSMNSPLALAGRTVCATLIAVGKTLPPAVIRAVREEAADGLDADGMFGATQMKSVLIARYLGNSSETAKQLMTRAWRRLRPELIGRAAVAPRIWNT
jgi:urease accessory protein